MMYENYLEHHGVKGMRWGVRRQKARQLSGARRKTLTDDEKRARRRKIAKGIAIGAGVALGAAGTAYAINRSKKIRDYGNFIKKRAESDEKWRKEKAASPHAREYGRLDPLPGYKVARNWDRYSLRTKAKLEKEHRKGNPSLQPNSLLKYYDWTGGPTKKGDTISTKVRKRLDNYDAAKQAKADHKASRAKEQAEYIRNMASKTASKNTSRNAGDKPYMDSDELFKKRIVDHHKQQLAQRSSHPSLYDKANRFTTSPPRSSKGPSLSLTNIDDYTQELLKKNAKRLAKAGY